MPYQVVVNTNIQNPYAEVQFIDADGNIVATPDGAQVAFVSSNTDTIGFATDPDNVLRGKITLPDPMPPIWGQAMVQVKITGANDTNDQPFEDQYISVTLTPPVPAKAPSIMFEIAGPEITQTP